MSVKDGNYNLSAFEFSPVIQELHLQQPSAVTEAIVRYAKTGWKKGFFANKKGANGEIVCDVLFGTGSIGDEILGFLSSRNGMPTLIFHPIEFPEILERKRETCDATFISFSEKPTDETICKWVTGRKNIF